MCALLSRISFGLVPTAHQLDNTGDARVDQKELEAYLRRETPDLTKRDAWIIMNCADANNDKVMTFDEFSACLPAPLHSACLACKLRVHGMARVPLRSLSFVRDHFSLRATEKMMQTVAKGVM